MAELSTNIAIELSELPIEHNSFLIQMNFYICAIFISTTSVAFEKVYSLETQS